MSEAEQVVERTEAPAAPEEDRGGLARGRRVVLAVVGGAALMAVGGLLATTLVKSPAQVAAETAPPAQGVLTADVERRVLAQTVVMRGTVVADQSVAVSPQGVRSGEGAGAALVTKLPLKAGDPVAAGRLIAEVSGRPVFTLHGAQPMYRDLRPGSTGDDVAQLQQALRELGHGTGGDARGVFGAGTKAALTAHYRAIGYEPLPAVADGGAALKAAREAVRSATWAVEDASSPTGAVGTPEETGSGGKGGATPDPGATASPGAGAVAGSGAVPGSRSGSGPGAGRELARARQALGEARAALAAAEAADGPMLPTAEAVFLSSLPARVSSVGARAGSPVSGPVLTLSGGELVVEAYLKDDKRQLLRAGMTVVISSEVSGTDVRGTVAAVAAERSTAQPAGPGPQQDPGQNPKGGGNGGTGGSGGADLGHRMVVRADRPLPAGFAGQDVRLTIESAATDGEALVVPVTAVSAGADGRTVVTAVSAEGTQRRIEVRTGTSGDGFVAVTPAQAGALGAGTKVVIGVAPRQTRGKNR
ncbi:peptidoglycan-binding domain-containing protein [Streptomyces sp. NRRL S-237]|uniref:peptidoglycan-binding domain-containing protein n=1 Tax=Streptomyces sp. NRRL S-237 TaxID=1463895 RepID=UPI001F41BC70|nr:peptidoglycan-binding domain-containing protein [Streptomyces sp. NRRL S-237]